ncbi:hypothetical protein IL54_1668 [Sphingobium sp. ba1]|nr:hypothetical protein IL54_1668 [Sphingobium sp. ba1]
MGALEHLDALDVEKQRLPHNRIREGGFVDVRAYGRGSRCLKRIKIDAAQREYRRAEDAGRGSKARDDRTKPFCIYNTRALKLGCGCDRNTDAHIVETLLTLLRGDDDIA